MRYETFNEGYTLVHADKETLSPLIKEVQELKTKVLAKEPLDRSFRTSLAGNLEHEFRLWDSVKYVEEFVLHFIEINNQFTGHLDELTILSDNKPLFLDKMWVNFQQKYEFNPVHDHSGVYSFVIWLEVPYDIKDEMERASSKDANENCPGHFGFLTINRLGVLEKRLLPVDKTWECKMAVFPARLNHFVHPFYTSDDFRISVSGNFRLKV